MKPGFAILPAFFKLTVLAGLLVISGCMGLENNALPKTVIANPGAEHPISSLAISQINGMPDASASRLQRHLKSELARRKINLVASPQKAAYNLKGFASAASGTKGTTLVHIWDILDKNGRRAHRIMGEEQGPLSPVDDPWAGVSSTMLSKIASDLARDYSAWSLGRPSSSRPVSRPALKQPSKATVKIARTRPRLVTGSLPSNQRPAAIRSHRRTISIAPVSGAPGDGNAALTAALKSALTKRGYKILPGAQRANYRIRGEVYIGPPASGKQELAIDWKVMDAARRPLGVINQRNRIKAHALNKRWGHTANAAAAAAASNIAKLLH